MHDEPDQHVGQIAGLQFSLATLLILVAVAAFVAASITELPEWIAAPVLALVATTATAVVVRAAIRSRGYALTFYVGAALPLCMMVLRTTLIMGAISDGVMQRGMSVMNSGWMQVYGENFLAQRLAYRWEVAAALACSPLIGLACVAFRWLGNEQSHGPSTADNPNDRRLWKRTLLAGVVLFACNCRRNRFKQVSATHSVVRRQAFAAGSKPAGNWV
jgi:hypothetical protein